MDMEVFDRAAASLPQEVFNEAPDLGIMLGSGWGDSLEADEIILKKPYSEIEGLGSSTVSGHNGEFILYRKGGKLVAAWCGRRHYYEGVSWEQVVMPVELMRRMRCTRLLLTNASGGINPALHPGDLVIIRDHINLVNSNPLVGSHRPEWGARFPDMSEVYDSKLSGMLHAGARKLRLRVMDGVYAYNLGPAYETPAEIRAYKAQGADVVGMSTVPEAVFAKACGMKIAGLSLVTNLAAGIAMRPLDHAEVVAAGEAARSGMKAIIGDFIDRI